MKVTLESYGGLAAAAGLRRPPDVLDSAPQPQGAAAELERLVAAAVAAPPPEDSGRARDARGYSITVEDGGRSTVLEQSDAAMSPAFAALLARLRNHFAPG
ncbi:protealysin inhibitor emfourin [Streptomyces sp. NPDC127110]|uniref:protealysin inhibitor emfourin n=1 Tax=Streptomyces sp. NPDC127110 TaxID=3345362 RepID=UPI00363A0E3B